MRNTLFVFILSLLTTVQTLSQDIESTLSGSSAAQGFTVKTAAGTPIFTIRGDGKVGIGTVTPSTVLDVNGQLKMSGGTPGLGKVLTSDANGLATWTTPSTGGVTLDQAYDQGGAGAGRTITADAGAVVVQGNGGFVVEGGLPGSPTIPASGNGTRMMFYPGKAAFRAGSIEYWEWDDAYIGLNSVAMGRDTKASGYYTFAVGEYSVASGAGSNAMGLSALASGVGSTATGNHARAESHSCFALGQYNVGGGTAGSWVGTEPIFEIGIGTSSSARVNAMTVLKNGNVGIGTATPTAGLEIQEVGSDDAAYFHIDNTSSTKDCIRAVTSSISNSSDALVVTANNGNAVEANSSGSSNPTIRAYNTSVSSTAKIITAASGSSSTTEVFSVARNGNLEITGQAYKPGGGSWTNSSDARLKNVDGSYAKGLSDIIQLRSIRFHYKKDNPRRLPYTTQEIGFVAQEVQTVFPECVSEGTDGYLEFNMHAINVAMVNAVQELNVQLKTERESNADLKGQITDLRDQVAEYRTQLAAQQAVNEDRLTQLQRENDRRYTDLAKLVRDLQQTPTTELRQAQLQTPEGNH